MVSYSALNFSVLDIVLIDVSLPIFLTSFQNVPLPYANTHSSASAGKELWGDEILFALFIKFLYRVWACI
jgi:hypothetical protein